VNPKIAATIAITRKITVHLSIIVIISEYLRQLYFLSP
jgi:hypothetical protein